MRTNTIILVVLSAALSACGPTQDVNEAEDTAGAAEGPAKVHTISEVVAVPGLEITVTSVEESAKAGEGPLTNDASDGEIFVIARHTIMNVGNAPVDVSDLPDMTLVDPNGVTYDEDSMSSVLARRDGDSTGIDKVNPGTAFKAATAWRVAKGALDRTTWKIVVDTDPRYEVGLK